MEINVKSYLENYSNENKDYNINDLSSNQLHLAKILQYVYVCNPSIYKKKADLYDRYTDLLMDCETIILNKEIPKYRKETIGNDILSKHNLLVNRLKFKPETFGEIDYVDKILNLPEYEQQKLKGVVIAQFWKDFEQQEKKISELQNKIKELENENNKLKISKKSK